MKNINHQKGISRNHNHNHNHNRKHNRKHKHIIFIFIFILTSCHINVMSCQFLFKKIDLKKYFDSYINFED